MSKMEDSNDQLILFLRDLASSIEKKQLLPSQTRRIGEFYMSYKFQEQVTSHDDSIEFDCEELIKFLCMGYYVYYILLKSDTLSYTDSSDDD